MSTTTPEEMRTIVRKLVKTDAAFANVVKSHPLCTIGIKSKSSRTYYQTLVKSILSQQLAIKAADTIIKRVVDLNDGKITPQSIELLSASDLRGAGVSGAKAKAIFELTAAVQNKEVRFSRFPKMSNQEINEELTSIWGIGRWTVEMFLIFHLARLDLWPVGDLGVRRGWERIHKLPIQIEPKELELFGEQFLGYQSVVAWYCWRALDH